MKAISLYLWDGEGKSKMQVQTNPSKAKVKVQASEYMKPIVASTQSKRRFNHNEAFFITGAGGNFNDLL